MKNAHLFYILLFPVLLMAQENIQQNEQFSNTDIIPLGTTGMKKLEIPSLKNTFSQNSALSKNIITPEINTFNFSALENKSNLKKFLPAFRAPDFSNINKIWNVVLVHVGGGCKK